MRRAPAKDSREARAGANQGQPLDQVHHHGQPLRLTHNLARLNRVMEPGRYVRSIFAHMDGQRSFGSIFDLVRAEPAFRDAPPDDAALFADFAPWYEALEAIERLVLRRVAVDDTQPGR